MKPCDLRKTLDCSLVTSCASPLCLTCVLLIDHHKSSQIITNPRSMQKVNRTGFCAIWINSGRSLPKHLKLTDKDGNAVDLPWDKVCHGSYNWGWTVEPASSPWLVESMEDLLLVYPFWQMRSRAESSWNSIRPSSFLTILYRSSWRLNCKFWVLLVLPPPLRKMLMAGEELEAATFAMRCRFPKFQWDSNVGTGQIHSIPIIGGFLK